VTPLSIDRRPVIVALAGPNGAGKTTFYNAHLRAAGLRFVNPGVLARDLRIEPCAAARLAGAIRSELVRQRESFVFETVFSNPAKEKLAFLKSAAESGYNTILCFIGTAGAVVPRILANLKSALRELSHVRVYDNNDLRTPYRLVAIVESGKVIRLQPPIPKWLKPLLP
jgi:predicted ABC-type ATPase